MYNQRWSGIDQKIDFGNEEKPTKNEKTTRRIVIMNFDFIKNT